jgi:hypothetical protein
MHELGSKVRIVNDETDREYTLEKIEAKGKKTQLAHLIDEFGNTEIVAMSHVAAPRQKAPRRKRKFGTPLGAALVPSPELHPADNVVALREGMTTNAFQASVDAEKKRSTSAHELAAFQYALQALNVPSHIMLPMSIMDRIRGKQNRGLNPLHTALREAVEYHMSEAESLR